MMLYRKPIVIASSAVIAMSLAACSSAEPGSNTSSSASTPTEPVSVELAIVAAGETPRAYQDEVARFNASHDDVTLSLRTYPSGDAYNQALLGQAAGGTAPDIFLLDSGEQTRTFADAKAIIPLDDVVAAAGIDMGAFTASLVDASTIDGSLYAVPKDYSTTALFYHKSMLEAAGVTPPTSLAELPAAAKALTTADHFGLGMYPQINYFLAWIQADGGGFVSPDGIANVDNAGHVKALSTLRTMFVDDKSAASPQMTGAGWDGEMFAKKQVAMVFGGSWIPGGVPPEDADDVGVVAFPTDVQAGSVLYSAGWVVSASSKHPDAAAEVIAFLTSDEELITAHDAGIILLPPKASVLDALAARGDDPILEVAQKGAATGVPFGLLSADEVDTYNKLLEAMVSGGVSAADTAAAAAKGLE
jgi:multiple sugar transport system substrate-binding protein